MCINANQQKEVAHLILLKQQFNIVATVINWSDLQWGQQQSLVSQIITHFNTITL